MNILYIGQFSPKSLLERYPDRGLDTYKTSEFLIKGFRERNDINISVITAPDVGSYPKFPQVLFKSSIEKDGTIVAGFLNLSFIKQLMITNNLYKEACKIIDKNEDQTYIILPYLVLHYVRIGRKLKARYGGKVKICQIIPDIFFPKKWLNKKVNHFAEKEGAKADAFILFTRPMAEYLHIENKPFLVMESVIDAATYPEQREIIIKTNKKLQVVYTGALGRPNGVGKLLSMMRLMKRDDFELVITGRGPLSKQFEEASKEDPRIRFMGTVPKNEVFNYQSNADVLINPRSDSDAPMVTDYMFPSKLMEYMLTGNPALSCRMAGIPLDYYNYIYVSEDDSSEGLANALSKVLDLNHAERLEKGKAARDYILDNKTIDVQVRRIVEMLNKI